MEILASGDIEVIGELGLRNNQIRDVVKKLDELGRKELAASVRERYLDGRTGPGMRAPRAGEEKEYKVQSRGRVPVILVPVKTIGGKAGDMIKVAFSADRIVVRAPA